MEEIKTNAALELINKGGLEETTAKNIMTKFEGFFKIADEWEVKAKKIVVTDATQLTEMKMAGEARKFIKSKRVEIEATRKNLKEEYLRTGKVIDGVANILKAIIEPIEDYLESQEKFAEIKEAERKEALKAHRAELLTPFEVNPGFYDLGSMPEEQFLTLLNSSETTFNNKKELERVEAQKRIDEEKERIRQAKENEKLRKENEAAKLKLQQEKEKADKAAAELKRKKDAEVKAAQEKTAALTRQLKEKELAEKRAADEKEKAEKKKAEEEAKAAKKAASAPDKDKLLKYLSEIESVMPPFLNDPVISLVFDNFAVELSNRIRVAKSALTNL